MQRIIRQNTFIARSTHLRKESLRIRDIDKTQSKKTKSKSP